MIVASNLQGCERDQAGVGTMSWTLTWACVVIIILLVLVMRLFLQADEQDGRAGEMQVCSEDSERGNHHERGR